MLAISPLRISSHGHEENTEGEILVDDINFDDIFVGFDDDGCDILPDLEIDPDDIFADFSSFSSGEEDSGNTGAVAEDSAGGCCGGDARNIVAQLVPDRDRKEDREYLSLQNYYYEVVEEEEEDGSLVLQVSAAAAAESERSAASSGENRSGRKLSTTTAIAAKGSHVKKKKKKSKVDWTPELHRRFVQAVEQLGVDKAVPSRILELMGIDCLTRHNIASHLQKYRSHQKHLLAREAEAASWSQRRQMYAAAGGVMKRVAAAVDMKKLAVASWQLAPPIVAAGFIPPPAPPPHQILRPPPLIRPLHVWGHPSAADRPHEFLRPAVWTSRHPTPPQPWLDPSPSMRPPDHPAANSYWHLSHYQMVALTQGIMPCFPPQLVPAMRFEAPPVPSIHPPHEYPLFRPAPSSHNAAAATSLINPTPSSYNGHLPLLFDAHPSNEKIDAAIGDVLAKPWSALPLGLKPPTLESVMVELQRHGVAKVPPPSSTSAAYLAH